MRHTCVRRARILNDSRRTRANGTLCQHKDSRREAAGYVFAPGDTRKHVRVYCSSREEALAKLTEKIAARNHGLPIITAQAASPRT